MSNVFIQFLRIVLCIEIHENIGKHNNIMFGQEIEREIRGLYWMNWIFSLKWWMFSNPSRSSTESSSFMSMHAVYVDLENESGPCSVFIASRIPIDRHQDFKDFRLNRADDRVHVIWFGRWRTKDVTQKHTHFLSIPKCLRKSRHDRKRGKEFLPENHLDVNICRIASKLPESAMNAMLDRIGCRSSSPSTTCSNCDIVRVWSRVFEAASEFIVFCNSVTLLAAVWRYNAQHEGLTRSISLFRRSMIRSVVSHFKYQNCDSSLGMSQFHNVAVSKFDQNRSWLSYSSFDHTAIMP